MQSNFIRKIAEGKQEDYQVKYNSLSLIKRFSSYLLKYKFLLIIGSILIFSGSFIQVLIPQITRYFIDDIIPHKRFDLIPYLAGAIALIALVIGGLNFVKSYISSLVGQRVIYDLRDNLYQHIQYLSLSFFENQRTGALIGKVVQDVEAVEKLITTEVVEIVAEIFTFVLVVSYLFYADWKITILVLITLPLMIYLTQLLGSTIRTAYHDMREKKADIYNHLQETFTNVKLIKACANEGYEINRFSDLNEANKESNLKAVFLSSSFSPIVDFMNYLGYIIVLVYGAWEVMDNTLTIGELTAFLAYLNQINQPVKRYSKIIHTIQKGASALERIFETLDTETEVKEKKDALILPEITGEIKLENITFYYQENNPVLKEFNLTIPTKKTVALVGTSGSGKTTIANLVARFYDPQDGKIKVDNYDLKDVTIKSWRSQIGIVSQETLLLYGSVKENIAYGKPGVSQDDIEKAAKIAHAHEFITELPQSYDTIIGEKGLRLSGGQRQRLAIARALVKNPHFLILDEATSSLDTESEYLIQEGLKELLKNRSCLVIAHRLSTIKQADIIVVLEKGKIIEVGSHEELIRNNARYAYLYHKQFPKQNVDLPNVISTLV